MIAYDTNVIIYAFESDTEWSAVSRRVVETGERQRAILSILVWQEVLSGLAYRDQAAEDKMRFIFQQFSDTKFVPVTAPIADLAVSLTRQFGRRVKGYDAVLLATAIEHGAEAFYTNDARLLELNVKGLEIKGLGA